MVSKHPITGFGNLKIQLESLIGKSPNLLRKITTQNQPTSMKQQICL